MHYLSVPELAWQNTQIKIPFSNKDLRIWCQPATYLQICDRVQLPEFPFLSHSSVQWNRWRRVQHPSNVYLIASYDPPGIPLKANLVSIPELNPCPSNHHHKWTILVHLQHFEWVFCRLCRQRKAAALIHRWHPCCINGDSTANKWSDVTPSWCTGHQCSMHALYKI